MPAHADLLDCLQRLLRPVAEQFRRGDFHVLLHERQFTGEVSRQGIEQFELVGDRQFDVDAFDAVGIIGQPRQRNDHVFVDLERVGVLGDRRGARPVEPEALSRFGGDRDKALAAARVCDAHHRGSGARDVIDVVAHDVAKQSHFGALAAARLGGIPDSLQVPLVQMLETGEQRGRMRVEIVLDFDNRRHRVVRIAEELQAHSADVRGHPVQDEARRGDDPVGPFLLHTGQAGENLVGDILAKASLPERAARYLDVAFFDQLPAVGRITTNTEGSLLRVVDLAQIVIDPFNFQPLGVRRHHAPGGQVVDRRSPQNRFLAAGIHRDVAADTRGVGRCRVHRENEASRFRRIHHAPRDDARTAADDGRAASESRQYRVLDRAQRFQLFGVHDRRAAR